MFLFSIYADHGGSKDSKHYAEHLVGLVLIIIVNGLSIHCKADEYDVTVWTKEIISIIRQ